MSKLPPFPELKRARVENRQAGAPVIHFCDRPKRPDRIAHLQPVGDVVLSEAELTSQAIFRDASGKVEVALILANRADPGDAAGRGFVYFFSPAEARRLADSVMRAADDAERRTN
ncbi:hypothetical protein FHS96_004964 [Sphingomonas zeicaulis]|uniref:hypothetical protein n=1 Tax=Sphingomonas zeicaulis TaxID=1632740 RepID=UPI003D1AB446